jgi:alginate O-acetyltransferase complex protein AlgI
MLLASPSFLIFLGVVFFLYWPVSRNRRLGLSVVLLANCFFYARWHPVYLLLIPIAATLDFLLAIGISRSTRRAVKRRYLACSLLVNLGLMASLKYIPFLLENFAGVSHEAAGRWHWSLPLGLSFYAFQSLTYTIDVYRRDFQPTRNWLAYLSSVSFFPTTLAGPITRIADLLPQMERADRALLPADGGRAIFLIGLGLAKKYLIADYLGENLVNRVFDLPNLYSGFEVLVGVYAYAAQLYYDFSGYTDIAMGAAMLVGIRLPGNFRRPYSAVNIADFWRRWHITLSNWLRDYLYFSLPGLRSRWKAFTYANLVITMVLGGLWHGPNWTFVVWGALHGAGLAFVRWRQTVRGGAATRVPGWLRILITANYVCLGWVFFRSADLAAAFNVLGRIGSLTFSVANIPLEYALVLALGAVMHYFPEGWTERARGAFAAAPAWAQAALVLLLLTAIRYVAASGSVPFIYTRF